MADDNDARAGFNARNREELRKAADEILRANRERKPAGAQGEDELFELSDDIGAGEEPAVDPVQQLADENAALKDQLLRLAADMENLRKRTARDMQDARAYAVTAFARDMLGVADDLRRGLEVASDGNPETPDIALKALVEGMELTERSMLAAMERHGVRKLEPEGQKFDPNFHQAMFEVQNADVPNNTVVQVVQAGFVIGERVLRPAMVGVAKGGPKQAQPQPSPDAQDAPGSG